MRLLFSAPSGLPSRLVRWVTWSRWSHVDVVLDEHTLIGSLFWEGVVRHDYQARVEASQYAEEVELMLPPDVEAKAMAFILAQEGKPYDYGAILDFVFRRDWQSPEKWICSELIPAGIEAAGWPIITRDANKVSPENLYRNCILHNRLMAAKNDRT